MSLVAYDASSDEESDVDEVPNVPVTQTLKHQVKPKATIHTAATSNCHISDDDDDYMLDHVEEQTKSSTFSLALPKPSKGTTVHDLLQDIPKPPFQALPTPKPIGAGIVTEEDDEFLHKKDKFEPLESKPPPNVVPKGPVKISIPSLHEFSDVLKDMERKVKDVNATPGKKSNSGGLLHILPQAKSERCFVKTDKTICDEGQKIAEPVVTKKAPITAFIPDSVKYGRPAHNTEEFIGAKTAKKLKPLDDKTKLVTHNDSDASDEDELKAECSERDFFSLASDDCLPEVSANEISAMVAKKAAKMAEVKNSYLAETEKNTIKESEETHSNLHELEMARKRYHDQQLDSEAVNALEGSSAKRRRNQKEPINIMELNSAEILPSRDEWMRTALASSTVYQPTGVLVDEEPAAGTRRKHQITYLAHKAKANEAELQAMWAANRQTRRATQSKYGF